MQPRTSAASKLLEKYQLENDTLRAEVADMKANGFVSSRPTTSEQEEMAELRSQNETLKKQHEEFLAQRSTAEEQRAEAEQKLRKREDRLERETIKMKKAQEDDLKAIASLKLERESGLRRHCRCAPAHRCVAHTQSVRKTRT